jgi:D-glycero-beta-D-manno-heptose 1-phosphate adenylyltransferase
MKTLQNIQHKIVSLSELRQKAQSWKAENLALVFTNGVFDLLHAGHIDYLAKAADLGNKLIVGVNADSSVKRLNKGPARPIKDQDTRALILASLQFVDAVVIFDEDTPINCIQAILPHVLVKGGDYDAQCYDPNNKKYIVGSEVVRNNGGSVQVLQFLPGHSTTLLEQKIIKNAQNHNSHG